jgi:hypothetical protein
MLQSQSTIVSVVTVQNYREVDQCDAQLLRAVPGCRSADNLLWSSLGRDLPRKVKSASSSPSIGLKEDAVNTSLHRICVIQQLQIERRVDRGSLLSLLS